MNEVQTTPGPEAQSPAATLDVVSVEPQSSSAEPALAFFDPDALPLALFVLVISAVAVRGLHRLARGLADRLTARRLAIKQGAMLLGFLIYAAGGVTAVALLFELSTQALFALSGTLAVAGGFLLKDVAESVAAGLFLVTRPFSVGDRIHFGGYYGEVVDIGLRTVRMVTLDDNLVTIPSSKFLSEVVASANAGALDCMVVTRFWTTAEADHERAREIVRDAVLSSRFCYLGKPISVLLSVTLEEQLGCVLEITAKAYVFDTRHERAFASDITERVLRAWREEGIALPSSPAAAARAA